MTLPAVHIDAQDIDILQSPKAYYQRLLSLISEAKQRIYITALYLENDEAGQKVLTALYQAKQKNPQLDICVFVDEHRAQRGLIGHEEQRGNRAMYIDYAKQYQHNIHLFGIAVKSKELFGVLHLKGMVFDDELLYSGASINNIYLHAKEKYRLDRYYQLSSPSLANSFCQFLTDSFIETGVALELTSEQYLSRKQQKTKSKRTTKIVKRSHYGVSELKSEGNLVVTPLVGCGKRKNQLNHAICQLLKQSRQSVIIFTPYFNLPKVVTKQIVSALKRGVNVTIVVGDKKASDFYIPDGDSFSTIGIIPYIYEQILRRFVKRWQRFIDNKQLTIKLWQDGKNSYHLKGIVVDKTQHMLTGSNLNPRAWGLDLENGLLVQDSKQELWQRFTQEFDVICQHTEDISGFQSIETIKDYPEKPRRLLRRLTLSKIDRLLKRFL